MDKATRHRVRARAGNICEYCGLLQQAQPWAKFHVEHIRPRQHQGTDDLDNLCLACGHCNRFKGPNLASIDPTNGELVQLFNPRQDQWDEHFSIVDHMIVGKTPVGHATVALLNMNAADRRQLRIELSNEGFQETDKSGD